MNIVLSDEFKRTMRKLKKRDLATFRAVQKKVNQIALCDETAIDHFKNLRGDLSDFRRVHIGSLVLMFKIEGNSIVFDRLVHHDSAYCQWCEVRQNVEIRSLTMFAESQPGGTDSAEY